ncbi:MAG: ankyrin repeat domain-containing protein, partial [Acidobacteriota bacterium]
MATRKNRQLLNAVYNGKIQRVKVLLEQGASPNDARDRLGSALSTAVVYRRVGIMELLLQHGADPNEPFDPDDGSLLHGAVMDTPEHKSVLAVLRHLVEHGANLEARTRDGTTPLLEAVRTTASYSQYWPSDLPGRLSVVRTLLDLGADLQAVDANGMNAVMIAQLDRDEDLVAELLRLGASSEGLNTTKLLWAVRQGDIDAVDALLKAGARPNQCFSRAGMPLADAAQQGHLEIVRRLLAAGADPNFGSPDDAPLLEATYSGHLEVMRLLLEAGADPNRARRASSSLLSYAKLGKREGHKPGQPWDEVIELVRTACGRATLRLHSADPEDSFLSSLWQETEAPADLVW